MKRFILSKQNNQLTIQLANHYRKKIPNYIWMLEDRPQQHLTYGIVNKILTVILAFGGYNIDLFLKKNLRSTHGQPKRRKGKLKAYYNSYSNLEWIKIIHQLLRQVVGTDSFKLFALRPKRLAEQRARKCQAQKASRDKKTAKRLTAALNKNSLLSGCKNQAIDEIKIMKGEK